MSLFFNVKCLTNFISVRHFPFLFLAQPLISFSFHFLLISSSSINVSLSSSSWVCFFFLGVLVINRHCCCLSFLRLSPSTPRRPPDGCSSKTHTTLLVETYHQHRRLRALIEKLEKEGSCPMQILGDDGDWTKNDFWAAVKFLRHAFRSNEILQVELDLTMVKMNSSFFKLKPNSFCNTSVSFALSDLLRLEVGKMFEVVRSACRHSWWY
ncbi:hypothetical protein ES288_D07G142800v1 [Gossypium darwinii]|uniref:Uncharacterized protein n=1 Tax=Gossypium darwinii TaxID=34276 RepID=A0A5D2BZ57_GOSDA|nr:hypothetical protein ES288_D07G142800v1 [Gossypium darwinii]